MGYLHIYIHTYIQYIHIYTYTERKKDFSLVTLSTASHLRVSVQGQDLLLRLQQFAGVGDVHCRFLFVSCQNPDLETSLTKTSYGFRNTILQTVLYPRRPYRYIALLHQQFCE